MVYCRAFRRLTGRRPVYADLMAIKSVSGLSQRLARAVIQAERQESDGGTGGSRSPL